MAAELTPEARRADAGEQQGADFCRVVRLLQEAHVAVHLNALAEGADGVLIQAAARSDDVVMDQAEMLDLLLDLVEATAHHLQHVAALVQLALQADHRQCIAQRLALQGGWIALQRADQGAITVAQIEVVAAVDVQRAFRIAYQQAAEHAAHRGFADLAGAGDLVGQHCCFEYGAEGDQLLLQRTHWASSYQASAVSITPPPRHTSPS